MIEIPSTLLRVIEAATADYSRVLVQHARMMAEMTSLTPIEGAFALGLSHIVSNHPGVDSQCQVQIGRYRVDFLLTCEGVGLVVECDGHDFHERTKEQAAADRSRDRQLMEAGYHVMRFTGREIYRDALACVRQAVDFVEARGIEAFWARQPAREPADG